MSKDQGSSREPSPSTFAATQPSADAGPRRVQLSRAKGWRMPENTVRVCRPTVFGNPYTIEDMGRHDAVEAFRHYADGPLWEDPNVRQDQLRMRARMPGLRGKNLACWCRLDRACHADVLLEIVNRPDADTSRVSDRTRDDHNQNPDQAGKEGV